MYTSANPEEPARVASSYQEKCRETGLTVDLSMSTTPGRLSVTQVHRPTDSEQRQ
jgi:hypothetical protein